MAAALLWLLLAGTSVLAGTPASYYFVEQAGLSELARWVIVALGLTAGVGLLQSIG